MRHALAMIAVLASLLAAQRAAAQADVSFPLGERYRVGKYLPVRAVSKGGDVRVTAPGAVPVEIKTPSGPIDVIVPLLAVTPVDEPTGSLRPLADEERLVGATTADTTLAAELFPGKKLTFAALSLSDPLPGPAVAWGALDAVFLDAAAAARVTDGQLATLLAAGTAVAVRTDGRPPSRWNWERHGAWWVARPEGPPVGGVIQPDRYAMPSAATPGWPRAVRRSLILILGAFTLAAVAASLWRSRYASATVVVLTAAAVVSLMLWGAAQQATLETVAIHRAGPWLETLTHRSAIADGEFRHTVDARDAAVWPILWSRRQLAEVGLILECDADGTPKAFVGRLKRGQSIAFLARSAADATPTPLAATAPAIPPR